MLMIGFRFLHWIYNTYMELIATYVAISPFIQNYVARHWGGSNAARMPKCWKNVIRGWRLVDLDATQMKWLCMWVSQPLFELIVLIVLNVP